MKLDEAVRTARRRHTDTLYVMSLTQENAADLHRMGIITEHAQMRVGGTLIDPVKNMRICHCMVLFPLVIIC